MSGEASRLRLAALADRIRTVGPGVVHVLLAPPGEPVEGAVVLPSSLVAALAEAGPLPGEPPVVTVGAADPVDEAVVRAVRASGATVVCRTDDEPRVTAAWNRPDDPTIVIPTGSGPAVADLVQSFQVTGDDDLAALLLPLAGTLGDQVLVHGARLPSADPDGHAAAVFRAVRALEERVVAVRSATDTDVPALRTRQAPPVTTAAPEPVDLAVLSPDWESGFGHYAMYSRGTMRAARDLGLSTVTLASRGLVTDGPDVVPYFHQPTYLLRSYPAQAEQWRADLVGLAAHLAPDGVGFLDCAGFQHVDAAASVAAELGDRRLVVNLMRAHVDVADSARPGPEARAIREVLTDILDRAERAGVTVTVDTEALREDVARALGHDLAVLPMSTATTASAPRAVDDRVPGRPFVLFPSKVRSHSSLELTEAIATLVAGADDRRVAVRPDVPPAGRVAKVDALYARLEGLGVELLGSRLPSDRYEALLREADVVVLPYDPAEFRTRTSGLAVDALLAGTPVVTTRGCWSADVVERSGGLTADFADPSGFHSAIEALLADLPNRRRGLAGAAPELAEEFSLTRRVRVVRELAASAAPRDPRPTRTGADLGVVLSGLAGPTAVAAGVGEAGRAMTRARTAEALGVERTLLIRELRRDLAAATNDLTSMTGKRDKIRTRLDATRGELASTREVLKRTERDLELARRPWYRKAGARLRRAASRPRPD